MYFSLKKEAYKLPENYFPQGFVKIEDGVLYTRSATHQVKIDFHNKIPSATIQGIDIGPKDFNTYIITLPAIDD